MGDKEDYLTLYRVFFENFAATVNPEDQLPVHIAGYTITESELAGEVLYWTTQYLNEKQCPPTLMTPLRRIILDEVREASKKQPNEFGYKSDESVYIALRLMQAVTARVNDVCLRYLDNSKLDTLPPPPPLAQRDLKTVSCATKNSRRVMEDRHVEIGNLEALFGIDTTEPTSFYAVYDGHAGSAAATYCAAHLHQYLAESAHFTTDLRRAMRDAFLRTDAEFIRKSNQERACGGSTAVAVCVRARRLLAAWAGDSLALLAKRMRLMQLVRPHKPGRQDERDRIESAGGTVMYWGTWRVNGQLAVSRAIGDAQYKPYVTARPEIATVDLDGDEDFVVVACDGLWDFVSEDDVALSVYRQLAADPDDLKAVTKRLIVQAKRQGSADNISIIVVFLKDPRDIVADNCPPMDLGLDNAMVNAPPFTIDTEACKRQVDAAAATAAAEGGECADAEADAEAGDNGVDNSDSDSEDLGPETAVDIDDVDAERNHEPQPPTPPAHIVEEGHVDGALVDNVAESGDDSEDEWNYFKGEGEREEHNPSEEPDEPPRSDTPCQDNSAWESSSVDMNSSPLNPDAPVFVPGGVAGADVLLAESPRKPVPMDDIELPDVAQFRTEAVVRPAELLDLDNCDQLNGHHNVSVDDAVKEHLNGNDKCNMDSLGFGFNVGIEPEKVKDSGLIQVFERIQKDTTDFCDIQVFQTHTETNPFAVEGNDELFERLKNKERDPMSMSFYQEKDDDTCERLSNKNDSHVDLNAVQPLPDSDDEDIQPNGVCENERIDTDKENINPEQQTDPFASIQEPNNDIIRFEDRPGDLAHNVDSFGQGDNFADYNVTGSNNMESYSNFEFECSNLPQDTVVQTDTPESHKLLFEQIPEIPDGKSSELGFTNDETQDPSESEKAVRPFTPRDETSQDIEMESKLDDSPSVEMQLQPAGDDLRDDDDLAAPHTVQLHAPASPAPLADGPATPEPQHDAEHVAADNADVLHLETRENVIEDFAPKDSESEANVEIDIAECAETPEPPAIVLETDHPTHAAAASPAPSRSPLPAEAVSPRDSPLPVRSPVPRESPLPVESPAPDESLPPGESPLPRESPSPTQSHIPTESLPPSESPLPSASPLPRASSPPRESPAPEESVAPPVCTLRSESPRPTEGELLGELRASVPSLEVEAEWPAQSPRPADVPLPGESPLPAESPVPTENSLRGSPIPADSLPATSPVPADSLPGTSPTPTDALPAASPVPVEILAASPIPSETLPAASPIPCEPVLAASFVPSETLLAASPIPSEALLAASPIPSEALPAASPIPSEDLPAASPIPSEALPAASPIPSEALPAASPIPSEALPAASPIPSEALPAASPIPSEAFPTASPIPSEALRAASPIPSEAFPATSPIPSEAFPAASPIPSETLPAASPILLETLPAASPIPVETTLVASPIPVEMSSARSPAPAESLPAISSAPEGSLPAISPIPVEEAIVAEDFVPERAPSVTLSPHEPSHEPQSAPAPDLLPERPAPRAELVTDVDIGIPESRAQEICMPVTSEIQLEEAEQPPAAATPPPTPAVDAPAPELDAAPLTDTPIAADASAPEPALVAGATVAAVAAAGAAAVVAAKTAAKTPAKRSPTTPTAKPDARTPKSAPKPTAARTPAATAAAKRPTSATPAARTPIAKASTPATRTPASAARQAAPAAKPSTPAARPASATKTTSATKPASPAKAPAARLAPPKTNGAAPKPAAPAAARAAPAARPATKPPAAARPAAPKPEAAARPPAARPAPRAAPAAKPAAKPAERKPMSNGDVKEARPPSRPAARPTPAAAARPAPRPAPRAAPLASAPSRPAAPRPAAGAPRAPLDKQSKDLANKRITAKAAPPRTAPAKTTTGAKKPVQKKPIESPKKELAPSNGLANGSAALKPPPSPPPADNALLPDVIA